jgi:hypothetical protein
MEYKDFFKPETLSKLNKKSSENLKQMLGDKNLIQSLQNQMSLLNDISEIEAPYRKQLENLAVKMIKELYPIVDQEDIKLDAKITDLSGVDKSLDEIKVNRPNKTWDLRKYIPNFNPNNIQIGDTIISKWGTEYKIDEIHYVDEARYNTEKENAFGNFFVDTNQGDGFFNDQLIKINEKNKSKQNSDLDEIKINKPGQEWTISYWEDNHKNYKNEKFQGSFEGAKRQVWKGLETQYKYRSGSYSASVYIDNTEDGDEDENYRHGQVFYEPDQSYEELNESISPESKRRIINGITQGAALRGTFSFYLFKDHLDEINPTLVEKYNQLMKEVFGVYDDENAIAMFLSMIAQGNKMGGGSSKVIIKEIKVNDPNKIIIGHIIDDEGDEYNDGAEYVNIDLDLVKKYLLPRFPGEEKIIIDFVNDWNEQNPSEEEIETTIDKLVDVYLYFKKLDDNLNEVKVNKPNEIVTLKPDEFQDIKGGKYRILDSDKDELHLGVKLQHLETKDIIYLAPRYFENQILKEIKVNKPKDVVYGIEVGDGCFNVVGVLDGNKNGDSFLVKTFPISKEANGWDRALEKAENFASKLNSKRKLDESEESGITIQARAICFPMLVHECIKGLYELVSKQGFNGDKETNQKVVDKVDQLKNEPHDLKYGKFIYDALNNVFADSGYDDSRIREFFFAEIYKLSDEEFIDFIENSINEKLTLKQQSWIKNTLRDIASDLKADDSDTALDEIKVKQPLNIQRYKQEVIKRVREYREENLENKVFWNDLIKTINSYNNREQIDDLIFGAIFFRDDKIGWEEWKDEMEEKTRSLNEIKFNTPSVKIKGNSKIAGLPPLDIKIGKYDVSKGRRGLQVPFESKNVDIRTRARIKNVLDKLGIKADKTWVGWMVDAGGSVLSLRSTFVLAYYGDEPILFASTQTSDPRAGQLYIYSQYVKSGKAMRVIQANGRDTGPSADEREVTKEQILQGLKIKDNSEDMPTTEVKINKPKELEEIPFTKEDLNKLFQSIRQEFGNRMKDYNEFSHYRKPDMSMEKYYEVYGGKPKVFSYGTLYNDAISFSFFIENVTEQDKQKVQQLVSKAIEGHRFTGTKNINIFPKAKWGEQHSFNISIGIYNSKISSSGGQLEEIKVNSPQDKSLPSFMIEIINDTIVNNIKGMLQREDSKYIDNFHQDGPVFELLSNFIIDQMILNNHEILKGKEEILVSNKTRNLVDENDIRDYLEENDNLNKYLERIIWTFYFNTVDIATVKREITNDIKEKYYDGFFEGEDRADRYLASYVDRSVGEDFEIQPLEVFEENERELIAYLQKQFKTSDKITERKKKPLREYNDKTIRTTIERWKAENPKTDENTAKRLIQRFDQIKSGLAQKLDLVTLPDELKKGNNYLNIDKYTYEDMAKLIKSLPENPDKVKKDAVEKFHKDEYVDKATAQSYVARFLSKKDEFRQAVQHGLEGGMTKEDIIKFIPKRLIHNDAFLDPRNWKWQDFEQMMDAVFPSQKVHGDEGENLASTEADKVYSKEGIEIYKGDDKDKCIAYNPVEQSTKKKKYGWCITQPGNSNYDYYRFSERTPTFYFVFDRNATSTPEHSPFEDPYHAFVIQVNQDGKSYVVTNADNRGDNEAKTWNDIASIVPVKTWAKIKNLSEYFQPVGLSAGERGRKFASGRNLNVDEFKELSQDEKLMYVQGKASKNELGKDILPLLPKYKISYEGRSSTLANIAIDNGQQFTYGDLKDHEQLAKRYAIFRFRHTNYSKIPIPLPFIKYLDEDAKEKYLKVYAEDFLSYDLIHRFFGETATKQYVNDMAAKSEYIQPEYIKYITEPKLKAVYELFNKLSTDWNVESDFNMKEENLASINSMPEQSISPVPINYKQWMDLSPADRKLVFDLADKIDGQEKYKTLLYSFPFIVKDGSSKYVLVPKDNKNFDYSEWLLVDEKGKVVKKFSGDNYIADNLLFNGYPNEDKGAIRRIYRYSDLKEKQ